MEKFSTNGGITVSLRAPQKPSEKLILEGVLTENLNLADLKQKIEEKSNCGELILIYRGRILKPETTLQQQGLKPGSTIQAIAGTKQAVPKKDYPRFTESDVQSVVFSFRSISTSSFQKASQPEFLEKILTVYPNLRSNLSAVSFLRDPILLASIGHPDTVRRLADTHRELLEASKLIVDTLNNKVSPIAVTPDPVEDLYDSSDSGDSPSTSRGRVPGRITSNQLSQALGQVFASGSSVNSLANISQRNLANQSATESTPTSAPNSAGPNRITSSMFMNALTEVLRSTRSNNEVRERTEASEVSSTAQETSTPTSTAAPPMFASELQQMREMGLTDTQGNLQALILTNGNLEEAVNIVLSGQNN